MSGSGLSVGAVARRSGVRISTLHFYEDKGLIYSSRNSGNQRRYSKEVLRRIAIIKSAQKMGITLSEIRDQLSALPVDHAPTKRDWQKMSRRWQQSLDERIAYLQRLREKLTGCIGCGCLSMDECPLRNRNDELAELGTGAVILESK